MDTFKNNLQIKMMKIQLFSMLYLSSTLVICKTIPVQVIEQSSTSRGPYLLGNPYFIDEGNSFVGKIPFNGSEIYSFTNLRPRYFLNTHTVNQSPVKYNQLKKVNTFVPNIIFDENRKRKSPSKVTFLTSQSQKYQLYPIHRIITEFIPKVHFDNNKNKKGKFVDEFASHGQYDLNTESSYEEHLIENLYGRPGSIEQDNLESDSDRKEINILDDEVTTLQPFLNIEADYTPAAKSYEEEGLNEEDINSKNDQKFDANECDCYLKQVGNEPHNKNDLKKYILKLIYGLTEKASSEACEETNANEGDSINAGVDDSKILGTFQQTDIDGGEDIYDGAEIHASASIDKEVSTSEGASTDRGAGIDGGIGIHGEPGISDEIGISREASIDVGVGISEETGIQEDANFRSEAVYGEIAGNNGVPESYVTADINGEEYVSGQAGIHSNVHLNAETSEGVNISEGTGNHNSTAIYEDSEYQGDANILVGVGISGQTKKFEKLGGTDVNISEEDPSIKRGPEINEGVTIDARTQSSNEADIEKEALKDGGVSVTREKSLSVGGVSIPGRASAYGKGEISEGVAILTINDVSKDVVDYGGASIDEEASTSEGASTDRGAGIDGGIGIHGEPGISDEIGISREASIDVGVGISEETGIQEDANFSSEAVYDGIADNNGVPESYATADIDGEEYVSGQAGIHSDVHLNAETSEGVNISEGTANHNSTAIYEDSEFQGDANILVGVGISGQTKKIEKFGGTGVNISEEDPSIKRGPEINEGVAIDVGTQSSNEADIEKEALKDGEVSVTSEESFIVGGVNIPERASAYGKGEISEGVAILNINDVSKDVVDYGGASIDEQASTSEGASTDRGAGIDGGIGIHGEPGISDEIGISTEASIDVGVGISEETGIQEDAKFSSEAVYDGISVNNGVPESYATADINGEEYVSGQAGIHSDVHLNAETSEGVNISEGTANHNSTAIYKDSEFQGDANILVGVGISGQTKKIEKLGGTGLNISEEDQSIKRGSERNEGVAIDAGTQSSNEADIEKEALKDGGVSVTSEESFIVGGPGRASAYGKGIISEGVAHLTIDDVSKDVVDDGGVSIIEEKSISGKAETSKMSGISKGIDIGSEIFFGGMRSIYGESGIRGQAKLYSEEGMSEGIGDEAGINHKRESIEKEIGVGEGADIDNGINIGVGSNIGEGSIIVSEAGSDGGTRISTYKAKKSKGLLKIYKTVYIYHS